MLKKIYFILILFFFITIILPTETFFADQKTIEVPITTDHNGCTFEVTMEIEGDYIIKLYAPNDEEFYFEPKRTDSKSYICTVANVKIGTWKIVIDNNLQVPVEKASVSVRTALTQKDEIEDDIVIGKEIVGLKMYLKNHTFIASWTDDSCGYVQFNITDLDTSHLIVSENADTKYFEYILPENTKNISVEVISSKVNNIEGTKNTYILNGLTSINGTVNFPNISFTNEDKLYVNTTIHTPYGFYIEVNGREVVKEQMHPAGTYEVEIPLRDNGENLIQFYMVDENGNMISADYTVFRDNEAPVLTLKQEYDGITTKEKSIIIEGIAQDFDEFTINGTNIKTEQNGSFTYTANLAIGENTITLLLNDKAGNETFYNITVTVPKPQEGIPPFILFIGAISILCFIFFRKKIKKKTVEKILNKEFNKNLTNKNIKEIVKEDEKKSNLSNLKVHSNITENDIFMEREMLKSHTKKNSLSKSRRFMESIVGWKYIFYAIASILFFLFILKPGHISSGSMEPTIMTNDIVVFNRLAYVVNEPMINDIISFKHNGETYCKRVIGIAGDEIFFTDGYVYRNGERVDEQFIDDDIETNSTKKFIVPEGTVFVLGDNREYSYDSRYWDNPYVDIKDIEGKKLIIIPMK